MASGDLKYEERVGPVTLSGADRTALGNVITNYWSGALADLTEAHFRRNPDNSVSLVLVGVQTKAPAQVPFGCRILDRVP